MSFGVASSDGARRVVAGQMEDEAATTACDCAADDDCIVQAISIAGASSGKLDVHSWDSDGITLIVDQQFSTAYRVMLLLCSGVTASYTTFTTTAATGDYSVTGLGDEIDGLLVLGVPGATTTFPFIGARGGISVGAAGQLGGTIEQGILQTYSRDGNAASSSSGLCRLGTILRAPNLAGNTNVAGSITARIADGVTLNLSTAAAQQAFYFIGLKGLDVRVLELATKTDTTTTFGSGTLAFTPRGGLVLSRGQTQQPNTTQTAHADGSIGAWDENGNQGCHAWMDQNAADPTICGSALSHNDVYVNLDTDGATVEGRAEHSASDADSVDFIMSDADPSSYFAWALIFGGAGVAAQEAAVIPQQFWRWRN